MNNKIETSSLHKPDSLPDYVFNLLRKNIISGVFPPGTQLKQMDIANQLRISQQTVREALKTLVAYGLLEQNHNHGFTVIDLPFQAQENIFKVRGALEIFAVEEAADAMLAESLKRMRELIPVASIDGSIPINEVRQNNRELHMIPVRATHNQQLICILDQLWDKTWTYFHQFNSQIQNAMSGREREEHEAIVLALEEKDPMAAKHAVKKHIDATLQQMHNLLDLQDQKKGG